MKLHTYLFKQVDNTPLVLWRILFGLVLFFETFGAVAVGWVQEVFIDPPEFTFNFIGFDWLQPLPGNGMNYYFMVLGLLSIAITLGYRYKLSMVLFTIAWLGVYFMHKTSYNNHHYLMSLLCLMMCFVPAHKAYSLDAKSKRVTPLSVCYNYTIQIFVLLLLVVFVYASVAKLYPDWLQGTPLTQWLSHKKHSIIGFLYANEKQGLIMSWGGIFFDLLIIPALMWKRTRKLAFFISLYFHIMNSITFQIGTFPYMMIGACVLFYPAERIRKLFRMKTVHSTELSSPSPRFSKLVSILFIGFFTLQIILPLRHHAFDSNVFWSEEGHKLSWRMMLRSKSGTASFSIIKSDGIRVLHDAKLHMTIKQYRTMCSHPCMIWQYCQRLKENFGPNCEIYVNSSLSLNFRKRKPLIDPKFNMAKAEWHLFQHEEWITDGPSWDDE
ncbi:MAG: hypothetical protein COA58_05245 [Bacteroidetes bacterium]|nr:MAG: hypothetical protein COA58_05245 [Bacteroidota bacterium]